VLVFVVTENVHEILRIWLGLAYPNHGLKAISFRPIGGTALKPYSDT
jgi:hypothetical protein